MTKFIFLLFFNILFVHSLIFSQDLNSIPTLNRPVMDTVGLLNPEEIAVLENKILNFEKTKGSQIAVLIIDSTGPETIEDFSMRVAETWKVGRKNIDDGVIFVIAVNDRKMRLEIGYGLEGTIPDAKAKQILDDYVKPHFKKSDYYRGIYTCIDNIIKLIQDEPLPEPVKQTSNKSFDFIINLFFALIASIFHFIAGFLNFNASKLRGFIMITLDIILIIILWNYLPFYLALFIAVFPIWFLTIFLYIIKSIHYVIKNKDSIKWSNSGSNWSNSSYYGSGGFFGSSSSGSSDFSGGGGSFGGGGSSSSW